jgi:hypothetical protein
MAVGRQDAELDHDGCQSKDHDLRCERDIRIDELRQERTIIRLFSEARTSKRPPHLSSSLAQVKADPSFPVRLGGQLDATILE